MTKKLLLLCIGIFLIVSVQAQDKKAANYNNKIIDIQHKLAPDVINFFKAFEDGSKEQMQAKKEKLSKDFDAAIKKVSKMKDFEGDTKLRDAMLAWLKLYESSLDAEYNHIIELASKPKAQRTDEDRAKLEKLSRELIQKEEAIDQNFENAQVEFAKRHNLELVAYPLEGHKK